MISSHKVKGHPEHVCDTHCEWGCYGRGYTDCEFCDGEGKCEAQVDVDSFISYSCTCTKGKWDCRCVDGVKPYPPEEPKMATAVRRKVMGGPWA